MHKGFVIGAVGAFFNAFVVRIICIMLNYGQKKDQLRSSSQSGDTNKYPGFPIL